MTSAKEIDELRTAKGEAHRWRIGEDSGLGQDYDRRRQNCFDEEITDENSEEFVESVMKDAINLQAPRFLYIGQAFRYSPENVLYIFYQQIYFIIWYLLDRASLI